MTEAGGGRQGSFAQCRTIELPVFNDPRGNLTSIEAGRDVPFDVRRVYYIYDTPHGTARGGHAHRALEQLLVAVSGSLDVELDDGRRRRSFHLSTPSVGLFITGMVWRTLENFSPGAVCLVLASQHFQESDYYRDYEEFSHDALAR